MKLNIEIRAWMCGLQEPISGGFLVTKSDTEAFARLIVERCAQEAENLSFVYASLEGYKSCNVRTDAEQGIKDAAAAIRNLMED